MKGFIIALLVVVLGISIFVLLWPAILATIGAVIGFYSFKKLLESKSVGEKILYSVLIVLGALMILSNLKGAIVVLVVAAILYFLTKNKKNEELSK